MRFAGRVLVAATIGCVVLASTYVATAQIPSRRKSAAADLQPKHTQGKGTVDAVAGGLLKITLRSKTWIVKPGPQCKIEVMGTAEEDCLRPGVIVRFSAEVDKKGIVAEPLEEIELTSLRPGESIGTFANSLDSEPGTRAFPKGDEPTSLQVVGRIIKLNDRKATIATGRLNVQVELKPDVTVKYNTTDYSLAAEGDVIEVKGNYLESGAMLAEEIAITLGKPVSSGKKLPARAAKKDTAKPPEPAEDADGKKA